ncbi:MAG: RagB/SusD family nutrient uptake outer membrane protein [Flavisolibacter sp.]
MRKINLGTVLLLSCLALVSGCRKFLDVKPDKTLAIPATLDDVDAILNDNLRINQNQNFSIGEASADNYYITDADFAALYYERERSVYTWGSEIFFDQFPNEWSAQYGIIYRANVVLNALENINREDSDAARWDRAKGSALFLRAEALHVLARNYAPAYDAQRASELLGLPLKSEPDFNSKSVRSTLQETFNQIINDLELSATLLPAASQHVMQPDRPSAFALLARLHLYMGNYKSALDFADSALHYVNSLIDYNTLNANASLPFQQFNAETIYYSRATPVVITQNRVKIDSALFKSYQQNDLRKSLYFLPVANGAYTFKGYYSGLSSSLFTGLATDEVILTKAEALARLGSVADAMKTLNQLLVKRWKTGTFTAYTAQNTTEALRLILEERRKELLFRDLRWMDIKRLNREGAGIIVRRKLNDEIIELTPNDNRYALPLPEYIISLTGMKQNPR